MANASVSYVSGITAVLYPDGKPFDKLLVLNFRYAEELGQPFAIEIELRCESSATADLEKLIPNKVIGHKLVVKIEGEREPRYFHAIMETFVAVDKNGAFNRYRGTAVPWYSMLKLSENSKIYYDITWRILIDIIWDRFTFASDCKPVLKGRDLPKRKRHTQYRETYFQFVQRSLEQDGLYYYWEHTKEKHVMTITDGSTTAGDFPSYGTIRYDTTGTATDCIYEWSHHAAVQPQQAVLHDYDYIDSQNTMMVAQDNWYRGKPDKGGFGTITPYDRLAVFRHPGSYSTTGDASGSTARTGNWYARRLAQAFECRQAFVSGKARCVGLAAGYEFKVKWTPTYKNPYSAVPYAADDTYLTTKMTLQISLETAAGSPGIPVVDCTFEAIPANGTIKYRPVQTVPTPRIDGVQSAIVCKEEGRVNPPTPGSPAPRPVTVTRSTDGWQQYEPSDAKFNKPMCDVEAGVARVQVKFHWCRGMNERTDWIRLTHLMAGSGWGEFHLPRPGDEVLVAFEHGDPDRPVIVGCLYNNTHQLFFDFTPTTDHGPKLQKVFAIKDPGGNLFIMDPGDGKSPSTKQLNEQQTITLYSEGAKKAASSIQIGKNAEDTPGVPKKGSH
jgi:type VI secretion system secreted protein VgrG